MKRSALRRDRLTVSVTTELWDEVVEHSLTSTLIAFEWT